MFLTEGLVVMDTGDKSEQYLSFGGREFLWEFSESYWPSFETRRHMHMNIYLQFQSLWTTSNSLVYFSLRYANRSDSIYKQYTVKPHLVWQGKHTPLSWESGAEKRREAGRAPASRSEVGGQCNDERQVWASFPYEMHAPALAFGMPHPQVS